MFILWKGEKTAWEAWKAYPEVTRAFNNMASHPFTPITVQSQNFKTLEHFTVIIYDKTSTLIAVNDARRELFCQRNKIMEHNYSQHKMPLFSTEGGLYCKEASDQRVMRCNSRSHFQRDGDGQWTETPSPGTLCGVAYVLLPKHVQK